MSEKGWCRKCKKMMHPRSTVPYKIKRCSRCNTELLKKKPLRYVSHNYKNEK